jgi:hypothetical protein
LGRGRVQQGAIAELTAFPIDASIRANALQLLYTLQENLQANTPTNPAGDDEDQELVMAIAQIDPQPVQNVLATSILNNRFSKSVPSEELPVTLIPNFLGLSPESLSLLLSELPQLSLENLMARLPERST